MLIHLSRASGAFEALKRRTIRDKYKKGEKGQRGVVQFRVQALACLANPQPKGCSLNFQPQSELVACNVRHACGEVQASQIVVFYFKD
jgi:hypothetical protein